MSITVKIAWLFWHSDCKRLNEGHNWFSEWAASSENLSSGCFRQSEFQTGLMSYRDNLENWNFTCSKFPYYTFIKVNNKGADQTARMRRPVCACVVHNPSPPQKKNKNKKTNNSKKIRFSRDEALLMIPRKTYIETGSQFNPYECQIAFSILIIKTSAFSLKDCWVVFFFSFLFKFYRTFCKQIVETHCGVWSGFTVFVFVPQKGC